MKRWSRPGVRRGAKVRSGLGECGGDVGGCHLSEGLLGSYGSWRLGGSFVET